MATHYLTLFCVAIQCRLLARFLSGHFCNRRDLKRLQQRIREEQVHLNIRRRGSAGVFGELVIRQGVNRPHADVVSGL